MVYIKEAHPTDGWRMDSNDKAGVALRRHLSRVDRLDAARGFCSSQSVDIPVLVDDMDDAASEAFSAFPDRLYLIDRQGRIVFKSGRGPVGFDSSSLEQALCLLLLHEGAREF